MRRRTRVATTIAAIAALALAATIAGIAAFAGLAASGFLVVRLGGSAGVITALAAIATLVARAITSVTALVQVHAALPQRLRSSLSCGGTQQVNLQADLDSAQCCESSCEGIHKSPSGGGGNYYQVGLLCST